jgi:uncharacterized protein YidB (DUF937 family)
MSLLSGILGNVVGSVFGANPRGARNNSLGEILADLGGGTPIQSGMLLSAALNLIRQNGGLDGVLSRFRETGLGAEADSWVGTGPNLPVTPGQLQQVFGASGLDRAAAPIHYSATEAGSAMALILPELLDQFTPEGTLPPNHAALLDRSISMLSHAGA